MFPSYIHCQNRDACVTRCLRKRRTPGAAAAFSPSSSAISLPSSTAAEDAWDPGKPSSSGVHGQARGGCMDRPHQCSQMPIMGSLTMAGYCEIDVQLIPERFLNADMPDPSCVLVSENAAHAGISAEELASMDPKRAKRLIANRQACFYRCSFQTEGRPLCLIFRGVVRC